MSCTTIYLLEHMKNLVNANAPYIYGGKGQICTQALIDSLAKSYPSMYTAAYKAKAQKFIGKNVYDCSGAISTATGVVEGSAQMYANAKERVPISKYNASKHKGWVLYKPGHVAVVVDGDYCYEARGINYGSVKSKWAGRGFTHLLLVNGLKDANSGVDTGADTSGHVSIQNKKGTVKTSSGAALMLRKSCSTTSDILARIPNKTEIVLTGETDNWYIVLYNGIAGYVYKTYIVVGNTVSSNTSSSEFKVGGKYSVTASSGCIIRSGASPKAAYQSYANLTADGKKKVAKTNDGKGYKLTKGSTFNIQSITNVTVGGTIYTYVEIPSGFICAKEGTNKYIG